MRTTTAYTCNMSDMHLLLSGDIESNTNNCQRKCNDEMENQNK